MQAIYIIVFISALTIGSLSLLSRQGSIDPGDATLNFLTYRAAVLQYAKTHALVDGVIAKTSLILPATWRDPGTWSNRVVGKNVFIWGRLSAQGKRDLEKMTFCSQAYFYSQGLTINSICTGTPGPALPVSIPNKTVVSVIEVN